MGKILAVDMYSNCCGAKPYGELDATGTDGVFGRCWACDDGAEFFTVEELQAQDEAIDSLESMDEK